MSTNTISNQDIILLIQDYVQKYQQQPEISTRWGIPQVGFADARHPYIQNLKSIISPSHALPQEVLPDARTVIVYFVPFTKELAKSNAAYGRLSSPEWALAYEQTNAMFNKLNPVIIDYIQTKGGHAAVSPEAATFDQKKLISNWSHRHFAYAAGLGTFGINNMLLTRKGCCGRFHSVVTSLPLLTGAPLTEELCLSKKNGSCGVCVRHCPTGALTTEGYDRQKCYSILRENARVYTQFGSSYTDATGTAANSEGSEVCGKCVTASPCMFWNR